VVTSIHLDTLVILEGVVFWPEMRPVGLLVVVDVDMSGSLSSGAGRVMLAGRVGHIPLCRGHLPGAVSTLLRRGLLDNPLALIEKRPLQHNPLPGHQQAHTAIDGGELGIPSALP
jgi:hypothetical protein